MKNQWTYHISHSFTDQEDGEKYKIVTQLYRVGVYAIINSDAGRQLSLHPMDMIALETDLKNRQEKGYISDLQFGREITVTDKNGFFEEITK